MQTNQGNDGEGSRLSTRYASPERLSGEDLVREVEAAAASPVVDALLRSLGTAAFVLNEDRQILAANASALELAGVDDPTTVLGLRPGEAVNCVHANVEPGGCGTSEACATCGAVISMLVAMKRDRPEERSCALRIGSNGRTVEVDLRVRAVPFRVADRELLLVAMSDVSHEQRQAAMERAFLHDISNVLAGLVGAAEAVTDADPQVAAEAADDVRTITHRLVREVQLQRMLTSRILEDYQPTRVPVPVGPFCEELGRFFGRHPAAAHRAMEVGRPEREVVDTDPFLLARILTNMLKNAFEATRPGGRVRLAVKNGGGMVSFEVHNPGPIPAAVVPRIFQRHFSTKPGPGRGEGTWSMRCLGEEMLHGKVGFETDREAGTTFWFRLPVDDG